MSSFTRFLTTCLFTAASTLVVTDAQALGIPAPFTVSRDPVWTTGLSNSGSSAGSQPAPASTPAPVSTPAPSTFKALWNGQNANAANWTLYVQQAVSNYGSALVRGPSDVEDFCPNYSRLGTQDRINFWVQMVAAMTKYESGFNPASRMTETTGGIDKVTGRQLASEGLMQLSYEDGKNYRSILPTGVCDFDYARDQQYAVTDLRRTILDPKTNLTCAVGILNRQIERDGAIAVGTSAYWAVIKTDRSTNKLSQIRAITKALPFCAN